MSHETPGSHGLPVGEAGVLAGLKVVELCHIIAGPYCAMLLADEGAEVIKIEPPQGEQSRAREPMRVNEDDGEFVSAYFASLNRRKKSVVLDLKTPAGKDICQRLISEADVFLTNMRPGALDRLGIHPVTLRDQYPSLIVASISGFGLFDAGEDADRAGLAMVAEALSGATGLTRDREGRPVWCGFALGDIAAATTAHAGILLALRKRDQTGQGSLIDVGLAECTLPYVTVALARAQTADEVATPGSASNTFHGVPYGTFAARDGYFNIGVNRDATWAKLCGAIGRPDLISDDRFATYVERSRNKAEVEAILEQWSLQLDREEAVRRLSEADIPVAPVLGVREVLDLKNFHNRGIYIEVDDGIGGSLLEPTDPTGFAIADRARIPRLGEFRDEVLGEIGFTEAEVESFAAAGAFGAGVTMTGSRSALTE